MKAFFTYLFALITLVAFGTLAGAQTRALGAHEFVLDDGLGHTLTLQTSTMGTNQTFTFPAVTSYTPGSVLFADGLGSINQNNPLFFWDNTHDRLGIGNAIPAYPLDVTGAINTSSVYNIGGSRVLANGGIHNLFVGAGAGASNTGGDNAFVGFDAGLSNAGGSGNTFLGTSAGADNTSGPNNTYTGYSAGLANQTGAGNTYMGTNAGTNATNSSNTMVGYSSGFSTSSGGSNTFLGSQAGQTNTTGSSNTAVGASADMGSNNLTDATALGSGAVVTASHTIQLGDAGVTLVQSHGSFNTTAGGIQTNGTTRIDNSGNATLAGLVLGAGANATTLTSTATTAQAISFPNASGTLAMISQVLQHITENYNNSVAPYSAGNAGEQLLASGTDANISIALQPIGTGAIEAQLADNGTGGGNARGQHAVDWQTIRTASTQVASGNYATISGGSENTASGTYATVSGGSHNTASGSFSTAMGDATVASGSYSTSMDYETTASGQYSTAMGAATTASGPVSTAIGNNTTASGQFSTAMGDGSTVSGFASTAMGESTTASGNYTTAMGYYASTNGHTGAFVYGDQSTATVMNAQADNEFDVRAAGGVHFYTKSDLSTGVSFPANGGLTIGVGANATALTSTATSPRAISFPNAPGTLALSGSGATYYVASLNPSSTSSSSFVQMGLGASITPASSGIVLITISGTISNGTAAFAASCHLCYGTGAAPTNGVAATGNSIGGQCEVINPSTSTIFVPFSSTAVVTGLTVGTTYWIDLQLAAFGGGTATVNGVSISAMEMP